MNNKIICILLSCIFFMMIFSSMNTNCKANNLFEVSDTKDILDKNDVEFSTLANGNNLTFFINGWALVIAHGDFYVEGNNVKGTCKFFFQLTVYYYIFPMPFFKSNVTTNWLINPDPLPPNMISYHLKYNSDWVIYFFRFRIRS